jgi:hypothetical protein
VTRGPRSRTTNYRNCLLQYQQMCSAHETAPLPAVVQGLQAAIEGHQERQQQLVVTDTALDSEAALWCLCDCLAVWSDLQSVTLQSGPMAPAAAAQGQPNAVLILFFRLCRARSRLRLAGRPPPRRLRCSSPAPLPQVPQSGG